MSITYHYGIDFGTTNSSVVALLVADGDEPKEVKFGDDEGRPMPSLIAIDRETGEVHSGREARDGRNELAETCVIVQSVKSLLDDEGWSIKIGEETWDAEKVTTEVFKALKANVEADDSQALSRATVAIPIGFGAAKRATVRRAARQADIEIESFVSEPTAAFFANASDLMGFEHVVIFDWGGGTLDVSVLENRAGVLTELATSGMQVGGDDIDERLARKIHARVALDKDRRDLAFDDMPAADRDKLLTRAERAKRALSEDESTRVSLNSYGEMGSFNIEIKDGWFAAIVSDIVQAAMDCMDIALLDAGMTTDDMVDCVVMVGGTSNLVPLQELMEGRFGEDRLFFPDETVWSISRGASRLSLNPGSYKAAQEVDIVLADGSLFPLLKKGVQVAGWSKSVDLGVVDSTEEYRIVFTGSRDIDDSPDRYHVIGVSAKGFLQETLHLETVIDENMVFVATMASSHAPDETKATWYYGGLKLCYSLKECGCR